MSPAISNTCSDKEQQLAEPLDPTQNRMEAWYMDDDTTSDNRKPHRRTPNEPCPPDVLQQLGVLVWKLDPETRKTDPKLAAIRRVRGYSYHDEITVAPGKIPDYEAKIRAFYREHIHPDEEIRFCLEGGGYFDIRDAKERWIRMRMLPGDFFVLPEGCYHRFCCDERNYTAMMRLFKGEPIWSSINRPCDEHESRRRYVEHFIR